jgi:hypothetical protein
MLKQSISGGVVHVVPDDLKRALQADSEALQLWENLTPLARNEWICWTTAVKKAETRTEHIARVTRQLKEGKRRPCCWIGCIHRNDKAISPSIQYILEKKKLKR